MEREATQRGQTVYQTQNLLPVRQQSHHTIMLCEIKMIKFYKRKIFESVTSCDRNSY